VRRGDILLFVTFRPGAGAGRGVLHRRLSLCPGSTVTRGSGRPYDLFTDGEWAWPATPEADASLLAAMKAGTTAVVTARSDRGTQTKDTFSLRGFTAAMTEAETRCK
jgi:hypothetical protein